MARHDDSSSLFSEAHIAKSQGPVECLGMAFEDDEKRREYFLDKLREKLKDPEFRKVEGFPIGEDEAILALSDPPYYTACPNPFIEDFIKHYGKPYDSATDDYHREPFAADVSEGRYSPETLCHSYHTKVPARAIARYLLHFSNPGDVVLDGFCGTGMAGVAAHICSNPDAEFKNSVDSEWNELFGRLPEWGRRKALLADLSPAATFYCIQLQHHQWMLRLSRMKLLGFSPKWKKSVRGCMRPLTQRASRLERSTILFGRMSFFCPNCAEEVVFWEAAADLEKAKVRSDIKCPSCNTEISKRNLKRVWITEFDEILGHTLEKAKTVPVLINYSIGKRRFNKKPEQSDFDILSRINEESIPYRVPSEKMVLRDGIWGDQWRAGYHKDVTHAHHYYTRRNLRTIAGFWEKALPHIKDAGLGMLLTATALKLSRLSRYMFDAAGRIQNGVLYIPSLHQEMSPFLLLETAVRYISRFRQSVCIDRSSWVSCGSTTDLKSCPTNSIDYVFTDPPFGDNLKYSELNFLWESWLRLYTNTTQEAVESKIQGKHLIDYQDLMVCCFREYYRVLKPGHWMTIEFHNSRNAVWGAIQEALLRAGFVVADVRGLDKKQGAFNQVVAAGSVKQDLVISAYKPNGGLEDRFRLESGTEDGVWDFVRTHMKQLPVFVSKGGKVEIIAERQNYLLFDRMVSFHVQRGVTVPLSAAEFYAGLEQRFPVRDGMYFLSDQAAEYDKKRITVKEILQLQLFVADEASAIQWLKQQLTQKPRPSKTSIRNS